MISSLDRYSMGPEWGPSLAGPEPGPALAGVRCCGAEAALAGASQAAPSLWNSQLHMQQQLLQLMQMVLGLMHNRGTTGEPPSPASEASAAPSSVTSTKDESSGPSAGPAATSTGKKLAEIARAEATDGDSKGGLCYRDVGRSLAKIGIQVSGASAYMAADQLARNPKVQEVKVGREELTRLPAGAIVVWDRGKGHVHGHISIATGDGKEASDLMRNQITNYGTAFRVFMPR